MEFKKGKYSNGYVQRAEEFLRTRLGKQLE